MTPKSRGWRVHPPPLSTQSGDISASDYRESCICFGAKNVAKIAGFDGVASPKSSQSCSKLPLKVASATGMVSESAGAESSKVSMVLYQSNGEEREHWLGSCFEVAKVVPLGSNGDSCDAPNPMNSIHPNDTKAS